MTQTSEDTDKTTRDVARHLEVPAPTGRTRALVSWVAGLALLAGIVAGAAVAVHRWQEAGAGSSLDDAPVGTAQEAARAFFTLDHRSLGDDLQHVLGYGTDGFRARYRQQSADLRRAVLEKRLVLSASVPESGTAVEYLTDDQAWVLVAVDVHTQARGTAASDSRYRTRVVLERDGERWLVSRLEQVG